MTLVQVPLGLTWNHKAPVGSAGRLLADLGAAYVFNCGDRNATLTEHDIGSAADSRVLSQAGARLVPGCANGGASEGPEATASGPLG